MADEEWRRIAGLRVVMAWRPGPYAPPSQPPRSLLIRVAGMVGVLLLAGGAAAVGSALLTQQHAPQPSRAAAGTLSPASVSPGAVAPAAASGPSLARSVPLSVSIPAAGVNSSLLRLGLTADGQFQVPALPAQAGDAAWYEYSATPGQIGVSVIEGHVDSYAGPAVFFRLGSLRPGDRVDVTLADGTTAVFRVTGVRRYLKATFPAAAVFGGADYAALRLITCGGAFDSATGHYLSSVVVFASLISSRPA